MIPAFGSLPEQENSDEGSQQTVVLELQVGQVLFCFSFLFLFSKFFWSSTDLQLSSRQRIVPTKIKEPKVQIIALKSQLIIFEKQGTEGH